MITQATKAPVIDALVKPSTLVRRFGPRLVKSNAAPIVDLGCGSGRNAFYLANLGADVICVDKDLGKFDVLHRQVSPPVRRRVTSQRLTLGLDGWPFAQSSLSAVLMVHFLLRDLFRDIRGSLCSGGYLLVETVGGQGENHLELPFAGQLRAELEENFDLEVYDERAVGPTSQSKVAVRLLGRRKVVA